MADIGTSSIHRILDRTDWNYDELKLCLEEDASSINEGDEYRDAPLLRLLRSEKCSPNIVRLLLHHGADVNIESRYGKSPLQVSLNRRNDVAIVKVLVEGGADMNKLTCDGHNIFCLSLYVCDVNISRVLIEAGCPTNSCRAHASIAQCLIGTFMSGSALNSDLLKLLMEKCSDVDWNSVDSFDESSLLCHIISQFPGSDILNVMLKSGCSWNACNHHGSPWLCATDARFRVPHLTKSLVQMLINVEPKPNLDNSVKYPLLHRALKNCNYEISAIQLMLDKKVVQIGIRSQKGQNALHAAVSTVDCMINPKIIKFLVDRGAEVNAVDNNGSTPLELAIEWRLDIDSMNNDFFKSKLSTIKALVKNGASVNVVNVIDQFRRTPLKLAFDLRCHYDTLEFLLNAGARIDPEWLEYALLKCKSRADEGYICCCKLLIKHFILNSSIDINSLIKSPLYENFAVFVNECRNELQCMKAISFSENCTLYQLIDRSSQTEIGAEGCKPANLNRLVNAMSKMQILTYFDVICARVDREDMEPKLQKIVWYGVKSDPETSKEKNIFLNCDSIFKIASYLSDKDLLKLLISANISEE